MVTLGGVGHFILIVAIARARQSAIEARMKHGPEWIAGQVPFETVHVRATTHTFPRRRLIGGSCDFLPCQPLPGNLSRMSLGVGLHSLPRIKTATPPRRAAALVHAPPSRPAHEPLGSWCYQLTQTPPGIFHRGESL